MRSRLIKFVLTGGVTLALVGTFAGAGAAHTARAASSAPPVKIGILYSNDAATSKSGDATVAVLKAAAKAQNARGGIGKAGQKVEVVPCVADVNDANAALACVNDWIADPDVVALVGDSGTQSNAVDPLLEKAGLASVGPLALQQSDFTSPIAFPVSAGFATAGGQATVLTDEAGIKKISLAVPDISGVAALEPISNSALAPRGAKITALLKLAVDKQDYSAEATQLGNSGDGIVITTSAEQMGRLMRAGQSTGAFKGKTISSNTSTLDEDNIKTLGSLANGIYVVTGGIATTDVKAPGVARYLAEVKKYAASSMSFANGETVKIPWLGFQAFAAAAKDLPTVDRASTLAAMNKLVYDPQGFAPVLDFTKPGTALGGSLPRLVNTKVMYARVKNGKIKALNGGRFIDPFAAPNSSSATTTTTK
jgi:ABC-type branched-subunit amino acid transport system substrate-binding protein